MYENMDDIFFVQVQIRVHEYFTNDNVLVYTKTLDAKYSHSKLTVCVVHYLCRNQPVGICVVPLDLSPLPYTRYNLTYWSKMEPQCFL